VLEGIRSYECTNEHVCVVSHMGVLLCYGGVREYMYTHISFDLRIVCCDVHDKVCTHTHKEDLC